MAKRFTDTEKWKDPWFCNLSEKDRMFWVYLVDNCDHAGMWRVNWPLVGFYIKDFVFNKESFADRVIFLSEEKWWVKKFVDFQYGVLNPENKAHKSVLTILEKEGAYKGLTRGLQAPKDKDKDKDKDKKGGVGGFDFNLLWAKYPNKDGKRAAERHFNCEVKTEQDWKDINTALDNYLQSDVVKKGFIKNGSTWFNNWRDWIVPPKKEATDGIPKQFRHLISKPVSIGNQ